MKKIEAIIRVSKLDAVKDVLIRQGVEGMTITEVHGSGSDRGTAITYRGITTAPSGVPRIKLETIVDDHAADAIVDAIYLAAHTGESGDGRIVVIGLESVTRIRTGETETSEHNPASYQTASQLSHSLRY